jgi:N-glycosylase/DNA lyase
MMDALFTRFGSRVRFDGKVFSCFWEPHVLAQAEEHELRKLKVGYRAKSLLMVSRSFANGEVNEMLMRQQSEQEQERLLLSLYGIGPASIGYIMFDVFHRWDYLHHISPWEQKIYTRLFFNEDYHTDLVSVERMIEFFTKKYGTYRTLAIHYIWEDLWWKRKHKSVPWLEELIML